MDKYGVIFFVDGTMIRRIDQNGIISTLLGFNDLTSARPLSCDAVMDISQVRPLWPGQRAPVLSSVKRRGTLSAMFPTSMFHVVSVSLTCRLAHTFFLICCLRLFGGCTVPASVHRTWNKTLKVRLNLDRIYTQQVLMPNSDLLHIAILFDSLLTSISDICFYTSLNYVHT